MYHRYKILNIHIYLTWGYLNIVIVSVTQFAQYPNIPEVNAQARIPSYLLLSEILTQKGDKSRNV